MRLLLLFVTIPHLDLFYRCSFRMVVIVGILNDLPTHLLPGVYPDLWIPITHLLIPIPIPGRCPITFGPTLRCWLRELLFTPPDVLLWFPPVPSSCDV